MKKIKSVRMRSLELARLEMSKTKEGDWVVKSPIPVPSFGEDYVLGNPDRFDVEYYEPEDEVKQVRIINPDKLKWYWNKKGWVFNVIYSWGYWRLVDNERKETGQTIYKEDAEII